MAPTTYLKLQSKHVLVIGGTSGIGVAVAEACLFSGAHVTISSSQPSKVDAAVTSLSSQYPTSTIRGIPCDLSNPPTLEDALTTLFTTAQTTTGPINHIVFTAADSLALGDLTTLSPDGIHAAAHMRLVVPLLVAKVASRFLPKSPLSSLTLTTGTAAQRPGKNWAVISYFTGGLAALTRALAVDMAPVRVNAVQPGFVDTELWGEMGVEERERFVKGVEGKTLTGRFAKAEDVAEAYLWVLRDGNVTGSVAGTDGGSLLA